MKLIDVVRERFPHACCEVFVYEDAQEEVRRRWPTMRVKIINRDEFRSKPWSLSLELSRRHSDVTVVLWNGERSHSKAKLAGLLSAARHILVFDEADKSWYPGPTQCPAISRHLLRRLRSADLAGMLKVVISYPLTPIGWVATLLEALPRLARGRKSWNGMP